MTIDGAADRSFAPGSRRANARLRRDESMAVIRQQPGGTLEPPNVLEAVARSLANVLAVMDAHLGQAASLPGDLPLLDVEETAELLGVSRMTVIRMVDEGALPSIIVRRGRTQKIRRIPRAFIEHIVAEAVAGAQVDIEEYAAAWLAENAQRRQPPDR